MNVMPPLFLTASGGKWSSAGGVVWDKKGRIAVVLQRDRARRLRWTLPKGRIDRGETIEQAALREVREESGLRAKVTGYLGRHEGRRHFTHYFSMGLMKDTGRFDGETVEVRFVTLEKARKLLRSRRDRHVLTWATQKGPAALSVPTRTAGAAGPGHRQPLRQLVKRSEEGVGAA